MNVVSNASGKKVAGNREGRRQRSTIIASPMTSPRTAPLAALREKHMKVFNEARHVCHVAAVDTAEAETPPVETPPVEAAAPADPTDTTPYSEAVMLQGFAWDSTDQEGWLKKIKERIGDMKSAGVTHVWLPPPSQSVAKQGYMPAQLYNLNSNYGSEGDLRDLVKSLNEAGIAPICDIVINHRCADEQRDGVWNQFRDDIDHGNKKIDWGKWAITSNDPKFQGTGNPDTGADFDGAPDLDHRNADLRAALKEWLQWLKDDIGFKGWRFDFAKGYGAEFVKEYVEASTPGALNVGEYWTDLNWGGNGLEYDQNGARQTLVDWVNNTGKLCTAFDFPTKGILQEAVKNCQYGRLRDHEGKAAGGIGWLNSRMVTFIANHDTDSTQGHWPFPGDHIELGNAYILTHPGIPCLFWDHVMRDGTRDKIVQLVELRKRNGINNRSKLEILRANDDLYIARIDDRVLIKMGPNGDMGDLTPKQEEGWHFAVNGKDFAVWEKK